MNHPHSPNLPTPNLYGGGRGRVAHSGIQALVILLVVLGVEAVEDATAKWKNGAAPRQAVAPVELVVDPQVDGLDELDGVEHQAAGLQDHLGGMDRRGTIQSVSGKTEEKTINRRRIKQEVSLLRLQTWRAL